MLQREIEIVNKLGLHARASAKLTQLAGKFDSDVQVERNGRKVNAKSIMGVMMLAAGKGSKITVSSDNGIVSLTGVTDSEQQANKAVQIASAKVGSPSGTEPKAKACRAPWSAASADSSAARVGLPRRE